MRSPNHTIIVNWKKRGFGCAKNCTYCNWRQSPYLPHGAQGQDAVSKFIAQCKKSFITISGGADPLYKIDENRDALMAMIRTIKEHGFNTRLITREVDAIASLKGLVQQVSISLDHEVMSGIEQHRPYWNGIEIEYSLVLPPLHQQAIRQLMPQYVHLQRRLGGRLMLRENLNSIHPIDPADVVSGHRELVFVSKRLCLQSRYLLTQPFWGHEIIQDNEPMIRQLMAHNHAYLFGGVVKHLIAPEVHADFKDIDLIATSDNVMEMLKTEFSYRFQRINPEGSYPHYFIGQSPKAGKPIQLVRLHSDAEAYRFVFNAQYNIDRVMYSDGRFLFDPAIGELEIRSAIASKQATAWAGPIDRGLFHQGREQVEARHQIKLMRKGFAIHNDQSI